MAQTFFKVLAPREALRLLLSTEPVEAEGIPSVAGRARVLADDLYSAVDLPHFHRAAMHGYAVKAKDTFGASQSLPAYLKLAGVVEMGKEAAQPLVAGEAVRISTGRMRPPPCWMLTWRRTLKTPMPAGCSCMRCSGTW